MIWELIFTAIALGLVWGFTPGPVILLAFSEILHSPKQWLTKWGIWIFFAGLTEFFIGLFLIVTVSWLQIPGIILHIVSIFWIVILLLLARKIVQIKKLHLSWEYQSQIKTSHIVLLMLTNWPLWFFWISVCVPAAEKLWNTIFLWQYLFLVLFEISMMAGLTIMLFWFQYFRKIFSNHRIVHRVFTILAFIILSIAGKMLIHEYIYFSWILWNK